MSEPTMVAISSKASDDVCMWKQQSSDVCNTPRSCYDCLNTPLSSGIDCVITSAGLCTTLTDYVWQEDYRLNRSDATSHYFPSTNTTYCEIKDSVCTTCRASQFVKSASGSVHPSQFCVGSDGCVCVGFCESPDYSTTISATYCATPDSGTANDNDGSSIHVFIVITLGFIIPAMLYYSYARRLRKHRLAFEDIQPIRRAKKGPILPLVGWKQHRAALMAKETMIISNNGGVMALIPAAEGAEGEPIGLAAIDAPLTTVSTSEVETESSERESLHQIMTVVTNSGRRLLSHDNISVKSQRSSLPILSWSEDDSADEKDVVEAQYAQLEERVD